MFTLAHFSDPHLPLPAWPSLSELFSKRILGFANWQLKRRALHQPSILAAVTADIKAHAPHHIVCGGDLVNIGTKKEIEAARQWIETIATPENLSLTPGNHDAYIEGVLEKVCEQLAPFMRGDSEADVYFPSVRQRENVAIIMLCTAVPAPWMEATGKIGVDQCEDLARILRNLKARNVCRVVALHHPPTLQGVEPEKRLLDSYELTDVLMKEGAELVLHGHLHKDITTCIESKEGMIPVYGVPSASLKGEGIKTAGWNLFQLKQQDKKWQITLQKRRLINNQIQTVE